IVFLGPSSATLKLRMYPSSFKMRAISAFSFDAGTSTLGCRAASALRRRVNISAIGSLTIRSPLDVGCWMLDVGENQERRTEAPSFNQHPKSNIQHLLSHLPTRLGHAGNLAIQGELPKA